MRISVLLGASLLVGGFAVSPRCPARAQDAPAQIQPAFASTAAALEAGEKLFADRKYKESRTAFEAALALAKTDVERAAALVGAARTHEKEVIIEKIQTGKSAARTVSRTDYAAARLKYGEVEKLPDLSPEKRAEARVAIANTYVLEGSNQNARTEFTKLIDTPGFSPAGRAAAYVGRGATYLKSLFPSAADVASALSDYESAVKLEGVPDVPRAEALLQLADLSYRVSQKEKALGSLTTLLALPGATGGQKAKALLATANFHQQSKELEKSRAALAQIPLLADAAAEDKVLAYRGLAGSYMAEMKVDLALAELEKGTRLPDLSAPQKAQLYEDIGGLQMGAGDFAAARAAYTRIVELPGAGAIQKSDAHMAVGKTYAAEKNYVAARET